MKYSEKIGIKQFIKIFFSFLDRGDKKNFVFFVFILMAGGLLSLIGVASVVPFLYALLNPEKITSFPILGKFNYFGAVAVSVSSVIILYWSKSILSIFILRRQTQFLFSLTKKIQLSFYKQYLYSNYSDHAKKNSSDLISMLSMDINTISSRIFSPVGVVLNEVLTSFILFIALFFWSPYFTIIVIGSNILISKIYLFVLRDKAVNFGKFRTESYSRLTRCISQSLGSFKETKLYQVEPAFCKVAEDCASKIACADRFSTVTTSGARLVIEASAVTVVLMSVLISLFYGAPNEEIIILISIFGIACMQFLPSINRIVQGLHSIRFAIPSLLRLYQNKAATPVAEEILALSDICSPLAFDKNLSLKNISFSYNSRRSVLENISLSIPKGKKVAFTGESGAGKTTLVDIILGLLMPTDGKLFVDGIELTSENLKRWQRMFGYIPQIIYLYDADIRTNVAFGVPENEINDEMVFKSLEIASLDAFVRSLENGIYTKIGENGIQLSGGQRQRIGIARALYRNPSILVMDEATAALDSQTEAEVTKALQKAGEDKTIITIAHRMSTIENYDFIFKIDNGVLNLHPIRV